MLIVAEDLQHYPSPPNHEHCLSPPKHEHCPVDDDNLQNYSREMKTIPNPQPRHIIADFPAKQRSLQTNTAGLSACSQNRLQQKHLRLNFERTPYLNNIVKVRCYG